MNFVMDRQTSRKHKASGHYGGQWQNDLGSILFVICPVIFMCEKMDRHMAGEKYFSSSLLGGGIIIK